MWSNNSLCKENCGLCSKEFKICCWGIFSCIHTRWLENSVSHVALLFYKQMCYPDEPKIFPTHTGIHTRTHIFEYKYFRYRFPWNIPISSKICFCLKVTCKTADNTKENWNDNKQIISRIATVPCAQTRPSLYTIIHMTHEAETKSNITCNTTNIGDGRHTHSQPTSSQLRQATFLKSM